MRFNIPIHTAKLILIRLVWMFCFQVLSVAAFSQHLGIGTETPAATSIVDIHSTDKGILVPRMTTEQRMNIESAAISLMVFDITTSSFWYKDDLGWTELPSHWASNGAHIYHANPGNVGIGLTDPAFPLDVSGVIQSQRPGSSPDGSFVSFASPSGDLGIILGRGNNAGGVLRRWDVKIDNDQSFRIRDNTAGLLRMRIDTAGRMAIGTTAPSNAAALEISSTTKGFLPPRMSKAERDAIVLPTEGLIIWCNDAGAFGQLQVYNGASWTDMEGKAPAGLEVGDPYQGGIVAYIYTQYDPGYVAWETHGIIAATSDLPDSQWGCDSINLMGASGYNLGTGSQNTIDIITGCSEPNIAAKRCADLVLGSFNDWFLPSYDELEKLYLNKEAIGGFTDDLYWSSSESNETIAWSQLFQNGDFYPTAKISPLSVRPVRYF